MDERAELTAKFPSIIGKESLVIQTSALLKRFNLTVEALSDHWEAFILPKLSLEKNVIFNSDNLKELESILVGKQAVEKKVIKETVKVKSGAKGGLESIYGLATPAKPSRSTLGSSAGKTSTSSPHSTTPYARPRPGPVSSTLNSSPQVEISSPISNAKPFHLREPSAAVQEAFNSHLPLASGSKSNEARIVLSTNADPRKYNYRYMYERMMERSQMLDKQIDEVAEDLKHFYGIEDLGDPSVESQEDIFAVGRLCSETDENKMTSTSTWLESSRSLGSGARVLLRFEPGMKVRGGPVGSGGMGVFPGCLVGVIGRNGGGKVFGVSEICMLAPPNAAMTTPSTLLNYQYGNKTKQMNGEPISVFVAAGPYTLDKDLLFDPLGALMDIVTKEKPDLVILIGPFIDSNHPIIKAGDISQTPIEIFDDRIGRKLGRLANACPATTVILIPSSRDLISCHLSFPQSPLEKKELMLPRTVKMLPNPTSFSVNEVIFSITSVDVLFHLTNQQLFLNGQDPIRLDENGLEIPIEIDSTAKDQIARGCRHLLRQRSFYPIFPAAQVPGDSINLDVSHLDLIKFDESVADIIIVPSRLARFTKVVDSTMFLNPSHLTKGNSAGTFSRLSIHPLNKSELQEKMTVQQEGSNEVNEEMEHRVYERCRVDLMKI